MSRTKHPCACNCGQVVWGNRRWVEGHKRPGDLRRGQYLPAEPLQTWIAERLGFYKALDLPDATARTAHDLGVSERRLSEWTSGKRQHRPGRGQGCETMTVIQHDDLPRRRVEEALDYADVCFADLYPEIAAAEDVELEPDGYCFRCNTDVTPIKGVCPWCESPVSADARKKHLSEQAA